MKSKTDLFFEGLLGLGVLAMVSASFSTPWSPLNWLEAVSLLALWGAAMVSYRDE